MRPKWNNLFWYERGSNSGKSQLENNTTKGLLKVLQETDPTVTEAFLTAIFDETVELDDGNITFDTQITLDEITQVDRKLHLLGLSKDGDNLARVATPRKGDGRVDGLITIDYNGTVETVVIEVKTGRDSLQERQLGTYRGTLNIDAQNCHGLSWLTVWKIFDNFSTATDRDLDRLLLTEFAEYLELMNMVPFRGFDRTELQKPTSTDYKRSLMRGINQRSSGAFAQALYDVRAEYGFEDYTAVSNQDSTQLHLVEKQHHEADRSTFNVNHYTAGFWNGRLNLQINIRNRIVSTITKRGNTDPRETFTETLIKALETAAETTLTNDDNPLIFVRYHGNIPQEYDTIYQPSSFYLEQFIYGSNLTDHDGLQERIGVLARTVRDANDAGIVSSPTFVVEKQLPYTSSFINDDRLPKYTLEFFETLQLIYNLFNK